MSTRKLSEQITHRPPFSKEVSSKMDENENYWLVQGWDDQTGQWFDIDEAKDASNASIKIRALSQDAINTSITRYRIVHFQAVVVYPGMAINPQSFKA